MAHFVYWRWIGIAGAAGYLGVSAAWIYDAGRRYAGFGAASASGAGQGTSALSSARAELERLRAITNAADSRSRSRRTAQQKLALQTGAGGRERSGARGARHLRGMLSSMRAMSLRCHLPLSG